MVINALASTASLIGMIMGLIKGDKITFWLFAAAFVILSYPIEPKRRRVRG